MVSDSALSKRDLLLLALLFLLEASIVVILKALHMKGEKAIGVFASSTTGLVFLGASLVVLVTGGVLIRLYLSHRRSPSRYFRLIVAMNLITVSLMMVAGEIIVRAGSRFYHDGEAFGMTMLKPKNWDMTRLHYRTLIEKANGKNLSYLVYDDQMGWSVGSSRRSANGLYRSSRKGIRAPLEGVEFTKAEEKPTVALLGDSFTFGEEVGYEDSWGYHLDQLLGAEVQVLNFGVPGYGVDQAYLRYEKDAKRWKPTVVIFGLFSHDFQRTMTVYPFLAHPYWDMPFSKPRFILSDGTLERLNAPPLRPEAIFSHPSIIELPFLELDYGYVESAWQQSFYHASYLFRLFVSWFPPWSAETPDFSEDTQVAINGSIFRSFIQSVAQEQTIPIMVYFPASGDLNREPSSPSAVVTRTLQEAGITSYVDMTPCVIDVDDADRFMPRGHLAPKASEAMAKCLLPVVQEALRSAAVGQETARAKSSSLSP